MSMLARSVSSQSTIIAFDTAFYSLALLFVLAVPLFATTKILLARMNMNEPRASFAQKWRSGFAKSDAT